MEIREIIKRRDIEMVDKGTTVADAIKRMVDRDVERLVVKRTSPNEPYGIVTRSDVLFKVVAKGLDPTKVKVEFIMSSPLTILNNVHLDVRHAAQAMANAHVSTIAIFDKGDFYGLLTSTDIITAIARELQRTALNKRSDDVAGAC